jgi:hypothetical protein
MSPVMSGIEGTQHACKLLSATSAQLATACKALTAAHLPVLELLVGGVQVHEMPQETSW